MSAKNRQRGKRAEKSLEKFFKPLDPSIEKRGTLGREDLKGDFLVVESKSREQLPRWLLRAYDQTDIMDIGERFRIVVLHQLYNRFTNDLCIIRMDDLCRLLKAYINRSLEDGKPYSKVIQMDSEDV